MPPVDPEPTGRAVCSVAGVDTAAGGHTPGPELLEMVCDTAR